MTGHARRDTPPETPRRAELLEPPMVLDACAGSRMFWFYRNDPRALYVDKRYERHVLPDVSSSGGSRLLVVEPQLQADFTALPFRDATFAMVVFDPPHLLRNGKRGWLAKKYGKLGREWERDLTDGFHECWRVLRPLGTLVFKWNEEEIPVSKILPMAPALPLVGNKSGRTGKTHWLVFLKEAA